jgi:Na+-translocating ferredoxin:NAD+ oxidoreductase subunit G
MSDDEIQLGTSIRRHSLRLGMFALGAALLLSLVSNFTAERIADQRLQAERAALNAVFPSLLHDNDLLQDSMVLEPDDDQFIDVNLLGLNMARSAYRSRMLGRINGIILPVETDDGYSGNILLLVGIDESGVLTGVRVLEHRETPGLGDKIEPRKADWIYNFDGRSLRNTDTLQWRVKKDGGEFDQFVGATITPRAVVGAVYNALQFFELNRDTLLVDTL